MGQINVAIKLLVHSNEIKLYNSVDFSMEVSIRDTSRKRHIAYLPKKSSPLINTYTIKPRGGTLLTQQVTLSNQKKIWRFREKITLL